MDTKEINKMLSGKEYDFLRNDPYLGENVILLCLGGSLAYGTNLPGSGDVDIRGITMEHPRDIIGFGEFEQIVHKETDTVIYGFNKIVKLLCNANPNTIEMLGCKPEHYFYLNKQGRDLIDNRKMFLSQRAARSFGGYADQQLNRLLNALARDRLPQNEKEEHILRSMSSAMYTFPNKFTDTGEGFIKLSIAESTKSHLDTEIVANINLKHYPVRDFDSIMNELSNIVKTYDKNCHRNHKKDDVHLNKHAMHLIRLYMMGIDILEKEEINTYREADRDLLLDIRKGKFMNEDKTYNSAFFDLLNEQQKKFEYACQNTALPPAPDMNIIEEFVMDTNIKSIELHKAHETAKNVLEEINHEAR